MVATGRGVPCRAPMIHYLVTRQHAYTMASFLESWGQALAARIRVVPYEEVLGGAVLPTGKHAYIFSDLDRLSAGLGAKEHGLLADLHAHLERTCGAARTLNDPTRSLLRYDLLRRLHEDGRNSFGVWRAGETPLRFPVFLRREAGFEQRPPALLAGPAEYAAAVDVARASGILLDGVIAVEFCDTSQGGIYRKYGAFVVGERIVPRHVFFSRGWLVKKAELATSEQVAEELDYVRTNPHASQLALIAATARISYGRIDYSLKAGSIQTWEINTNPLLASPATEEIPARHRVHLEFAAQLDAAFAAIELR